MTDPTQSVLVLGGRKDRLASYEKLAAGGVRCLIAARTGAAVVRWMTATTYGPLLSALIEFTSYPLLGTRESLTGSRVLGHGG